MEEVDPQILAAARRHDREALGEVLAAVQPQIWRFVAAMERDRETVADLTQETLLRVVSALPASGVRAVCTPGRAGSLATSCVTTSAGCCGDRGQSRCSTTMARGSRR
ncbi:MAG: sigma factor [Acidimicrobiales bacterium]